MLLSRVQDQNFVKGPMEGGGDEVHYYECRPPRKPETKSLGAEDFIILYKKKDLCAEEIPNANEVPQARANQYTESVVYNDYLDSDSDESEICNEEEIQNSLAISSDNQEDYFINASCNNFEDINMNGFSNYINPLPFKCSSLNKGNYFLDEPNTLLNYGSFPPYSILDYISCKRFDEVYNFYLDNIITYVKNTIGQLKRISNGDYLTEKAKQKWREMGKTVCAIEDRPPCYTKILSDTKAVPQVFIKPKTNYGNISWDNIDLTFLSKIMTKIIIQVPKPIGDSKRYYKIVACMQVKKDNKKKNFNSSTGIPAITALKPSTNDVQLNNNLNEESMITTASIDRNMSKNIMCKEILTVSEYISNTMVTGNTQSDDSLDFANYNINNNLRNVDNRYNLNKFVHCKKIVTFKPYGLNFTMKKLNDNEPLLEENSMEETIDTVPKIDLQDKIKQQSPFSTETSKIKERKLKKLLEIRQKREKQKLALSEKCNNIAKKYIPVMTQPSCSVTRLSITNKSFYDSIYGQNCMNVEQRSLNHKNRKNLLDFYNNNDEDESQKVITSQLSSKMKGSTNLNDCSNKKKYNEMPNMDKDTNINSESKAASKIAANYESRHLNISSECSNFIASHVHVTGEPSDALPINNNSPNSEKKIKTLAKQTPFQTVINTSSMEALKVNTPMISDKYFKDPTISVGYMQNVKNIYNYIKDLKRDNDRTKAVPKCNKDAVSIIHNSSKFESSDSVTSVTCQLSSSIQSCTNSDEKPIINNHKKKNGKSLIPKIIINAKTLCHPGSEKDRLKENLSKLFTNHVGKARFANNDTNSNKVDKDDGPKALLKNSAIIDKRVVVTSNVEKLTRDRLSKNIVRSASNTLDHKVETRKISKTFTKRLDDLDEIKEARGEAVRGPSKLKEARGEAVRGAPKSKTVRFSLLPQSSKNEEDQLKRKTNLMANKLQRTSSKLNISVKNWNTSVLQDRKRSGNLERISKFENHLRDSGKPTTEVKKSTIKKSYEVSNSPEIKKKIADIETRKSIHYEDFLPKNDSAIEDELLMKHSEDTTDSKTICTNSSSEESMKNNFHKIIDIALRTRPIIKCLVNCNINLSDNSENKNQKVNNILKIDSNNSYEQNNELLSEFVNAQELNNIEDYILQNRLYLRNSKETKCTLAKTIEFHKGLNDRKSMNSLQNNSQHSLSPSLPPQQALIIDSKDVNVILQASTHSTNVIITESKSKIKQDFTVLPKFYYYPHKFLHAPSKQVTSAGITIPEYGLSKLPIITCEKTTQCYIKNVIEEPATTCEVKKRDIPMKLKDEQTEINESDLKEFTRSDNEITEIYPDSLIECKAKEHIIDYSSSLDMLVNLLNEITNITLEQTKSNVRLYNMKTENSSKDHDIEKRACTGFSVPLLHKLRQLKSDSTLHSLCVSDNTFQPRYVDKETGPNKDSMDTVIEGPSRSLPVKISHSTFMADASIQELNSNSLQPRVPIDRKCGPDTCIINFVISAVKVKHPYPIQVKNTTEMASYLEPIIKMKRYILVIAYSLFVFTVFAALSFPALFISCL